MLQTHTWCDCSFCEGSAWKRSNRSQNRIQIYKGISNSLTYLYTMQCSFWYFYYQPEKACHSQPSAWVTVGCNGRGFRAGTLKSKPCLVEESQSRELTESCEWHPSGSWRSQSYSTSGKLAYTLGSLKRTCSYDIRWRLLYWFLWRCSVFQSGLYSPIKSTDISPLLIFPHSNYELLKKKKCERASMRIFSESQRNPDSDYRLYIWGIICPHPPHPFFFFNPCTKSFHVGRKFSASEITV